MIYNSHVGDGLRNSLDDLPIVVKETVATLRKHRKKFDCIVVRGMSGVTVGAPVSIALKCPLIVVRKPADDAHNAYRKVIGQAGDKPLFLDDFVSSGHTRAECEKAIAPTRIVAQYEYDDKRFKVLPK